MASSAAAQDDPLSIVEKARHKSGGTSGGHRWTTNFRVLLPHRPGALEIRSWFHQTLSVCERPGTHERPVSGAGLRGPRNQPGSKIYRGAVRYSSDWVFNAVSEEVDNGFAEIGGQNFFLPLRARLDVTLRDGSQTRNEMEFGNYRKFSSEATLQFEQE